MIGKEVIFNLSSGVTKAMSSHSICSSSLVDIVKSTAR